MPSLDPSTRTGTPWKEIVVTPSSGKVHQAGAPEYSDGDFQNTIRSLAERSLFFFAKAIIGGPKGPPITQELHLPVCQFLQRRPPFRKGLLLPRNHAKTFLVSICLPPHILIQPPETNIYFPGLDGSDCRILLSGETAAMAEKNHRSVQAIFEAHTLFRALWPHRTYQNPAREARKWNANELIIPRSTEYPDPSLRAVGVGVAVTGARPNIQIKDDLISLEARNSEIVMARAIEWHKASRALFEEYTIDSGLASLEFIIGCLTGDSLVLMQNGYRKPIKDVEPGDIVWSSNTDKSFKPCRVKAVIPQGPAQTFTVKTTAHSLRATGNHPFLVWDGYRGLVWKKCEDLTSSDLVVSLKELREGNEGILTKEQYWLLGFMLADGNVCNRERRGYVYFSEKANNLHIKALRIFKEWFRDVDFHFQEHGRQFRADSCHMATRLDELGLSGTSKTKRLPDWVFGLTSSNRIEVLRGLCETDGTFWGRQSWNVEISNKALLEDLRHLANLCGVRTGELTTRTRKIKPPNSPKPVISTTWRSSFNFATIGRTEMGNAGRDTQLPDSLRFERIVSVEKNSILEEVYDLSVEGTPSFFANNLAVHNTHWAVFDLYTYIQAEDPTVEWFLDFKSIVKDGHCIWPERFSFKTLKDSQGNVLKEGVEDLKKQFGSLFPLMYMNDANDPDLVDFDMSLVREFRIENGQFIFQEDARDTLLAKASEIGNLGLPVGAEMKAQEVMTEFMRQGRNEYLRLKYA